jgi:hypothetical protein
MRISDRNPTSCCSVVIEKLLVAQLIKNIPSCMETEALFQCSEEPATGLYPGPVACS